MEIGKEIKRRERRRREKWKNLSRRQAWEERDGTARRKRKVLGNVPGRGYIQRRIETHGAENQFDIGVDPYSRNAKYLSGRILSEEQAIRVMAVPLVSFILLSCRLLFILSRSGEIIRERVTNLVSSRIAETLRFPVKKK